MKLLLIDSRINEKQIFIDSCTPDTHHIIFDYNIDTYDSILGRDKFEEEKYTDIALVQHTDMVIGIKMLEQEPRCDSYDSAPYSSFDRLRSFLRTLKERNGVQRFDFLGCAMYDAQIMPTIFSALEADIGMDLRASTNFTGNAPDGDWIMESDNVDIRDKYFTEAIQEWRGTLGMPYLRAYGQTYGISGDIVGIASQSIVVSSNDYVQEAYTYGNTLINITGAIPDNLKNIRIKQIITNKYSNLFAAIDISNFVWTWGSNGIAFIPSSLVGIPVTTVIPGFDGFAIITDISKTMYTWGGNSGYGGVNGNNGGIPTNLQNVRVNKIVSSGYGYGILSEDKKVYFMGNANTYGTAITPIGLSGVLIKDIVSTLNAYAVITESNNVFAWGEISQGGTSSNFTTALTPSGLENIQVTTIVSNALAFSAIDISKRVWAWGSITQGGAGTATTIAATPSGLMNIPISKIYGFTGGFSQSVFIAIAETTKQLYLWGHSTYGGLNNGTSTTPIGLLGVSVEEVFNNQAAIACIDSDGIVRTFGNASAGGGTGAIPTNLTNVTISNIVSGRFSFSALSLSGDVYSWGSLYATGGETYGNGGTTAIKINGLQNIKQIGATFEGYVALSNNSKLYVWNNMPQSVGKSTAIIPSGLYYNTFDSIYTHNYSFAAISKDTQTVYTGGDINFGALNALDKLTLILPGKRIIKNVTHGMAHTVLTDEPFGNVYTYGGVEGDKIFRTYSSIPSIPTNLQNRKIINIYTTDDTFAALDSSKNLWTWGTNGAGINHTNASTFNATIMTAQIPAGISGVPIKDVYSINARFYAISDISKNLYSVNVNSGSIPTGLAGIPIKKVVANPSSFAVITDISNRVYTLGDTNNGGAGINSSTAGIPSGLENIEIDQIATTQIAFAVIDKNKKLWCWGGYGGGGVNANTKLAVTPSGLENITFKSVVANERAFAAVSETGTVYAWGMNDRGGAGIDNYTAVTPSGLINIPVTYVVNSIYAFAAITDISKNVYAWGQINNGGGGVTTREARIPSGLQGIPIKGIVSNQYSFAAVTDISDRVYAWGHVGSGGVGVNNSSAAIPIGLENVSISGLIANQYHYQAIQSDGTLYTWGMLDYQVWWQNYRTYQFFNKRSTVRHAVADTALTGRGINLIEGSTPLLVPTAPRNASVVVGNTEATVSFTASQYTGNSPILHYEVNVNNGAIILTSETVAQITLSGLTNGITYTATVKAINAIGSSAASNTLTFIPGTPLPPTTVTKVASNGQIVVSFNESPNNNGSAVTYYIVSVSGQDISGLTSPITFTGLTNGQSYNITVKAVNEFGIGAASVPITGMPGIVPGVPTISKITPNGTSATLTVSPGTVGTTRTEYYIVESIPAGITISGSTGNLVVTGLVAGNNYQFTAKAVNSIGESIASAQSNIITAFNLGLPYFKYFRFTAQARVAGTALQYSEFILLYNGQRISSTGAIVYDISGNTSNTGLNFSNTLDNNVNTKYYDANKNPLIFEYPTQMYVDSFTYSTGNDGPERDPVTWVLAGSNDKNTWTNLHIQSTAFNVTTSRNTQITPSFTLLSTIDSSLKPSAPTGLTALPGTGQITVNFTPPPDVSGFPTSSYNITITPGDVNRTFVNRPITISGLTNGTPHTITVAAINANGAGAAATISGIRPATVPAAPTLLSVSGGDTVARVSFSAPLNDGGSTITNFMAISTPDNKVGYGLVSPITISGLTDGIPYTFKVAAINAVGTGAYSASSSSITLTTSIPTTAAQAIALSAPSTTSNTVYIDTFVQASTKTVAEIFVELRAAKKVAAATKTVSQISELTKAISKSIATKAASPILDVSFASIVPTLTTTYANIEEKPVAAILPDFTTNTPPVIDLSSLILQDKHILIEAPENSTFSLTDGTVTKSFTLSTLSGEKYMYDNDDVSKKYYVGSVLSFGSFSKRILGFGSVIFGTANVSVTIPITFTVSGVDVNILGQLFTMAGIKINVNNTASVSGFYDPSGYSWIQYKQGANEDDFTAGVKDFSGAVAVKNTLLKALNISGGSIYDAARQGTTNLDCSAVFVGHQSKWTNFHNLQDFVLSYFANKVLGHPGALAAISNDSQIRANVTNGFPLALEELKTMQEDKLKSIVQQMMNQDLARFNGDEKDVYNPLKFRAGDKVIMRMILADNTYSLKSPAGNPSSVVGGVTTAQSASATTTSVNIGSNDDYLLVFTLA
jgi:alpha-tubulin suppressor-like RCC1 family protein